MIIHTPMNEVFVPDGKESVKDMTRRYMLFLEQYCGGEIYKPNKTKWEREKLPTEAQAERMTKEELRQLQEYVVKRWRSGHKNMCGLQWGYFNLGWIKKRSGGQTRPEWRRHDNERMDLAEACLFGKSRFHQEIKKGTGVIELGKRNIGKSAGLGFVGVTIINLIDATNVLMTSKTEDDGEKFMKNKVKFPLYRLPWYARSKSNTDNRSTIHTGEKIKNPYGHIQIIGRDSYFNTTAPVAEAIEGEGGMLWIHDEGPKTKGLKPLMVYTLPALLGDNDERDGVPWITGVAGDFSKFGQDYIEIWEHAAVYDFVRSFIPGWTSMFTDEFFNEDVERAVYEILSRREKQFSISEADGYMHMQQFPLTPEEALQNAAEGVLPKEIIRARRQYINMNPKVYRRGDIDVNDLNGKPIFIPNNRGPLKILELPTQDASYLCAFIDAYDIQEKATKGSKGCMIVFKRDTKLSQFDIDKIAAELQLASDIEDVMKLHLKLGHMPIAILFDNPDDPRDFGKKCELVIKWYGVITAVEKFPSPIFLFLDSSEVRDKIQYKFVRPDKINLTRADYSVKGMKFDEYWKDLRTSELRNYYRVYSSRIYFEELLDGAESYDPAVQTKKYDAIDTLGGAILHSKQPFLPEVGSDKRDEDEARQPFYGYVRTNNGIMPA